MLWETYLKSFPEGTNPIYKEREEHNCNCCRSFIRQVGKRNSKIFGLKALAKNESWKLSIRYELTKLWCQQYEKELPVFETLYKKKEMQLSISEIEKIEEVKNRVLV